MKVDGARIFAGFFNGAFDDNKLAVNILSEFFKSLGDSGGVYRAEDGAGGAGLGL